jgi:Calx-beta domain/Right handed beta helix region
LLIIQIEKGHLCFCTLLFFYILGEIFEFYYKERDMRNFRIFGLLVFFILAFSLNALSQVTVSGSTGANGSYTELNLAFTALNGAGTQAGNNISINITGNTTETASAVLNAGDWTSVTIRPTVTATVQGTIVGAIIKLNGADNVTIDGRIGGVGTNRDLTVRNNSTAAATAAIWLASVAAGNGASNNVIRNLEIAAGATANTNTNTTIGILMAGTTVSVTADGNDNDNNQFLFNRITRARYGLVTRGVAANNNEGLVIADNIVGPASFGADEIGKAGIFLQQDNGAQVTRNTVQFVGGDLANTTAGADRCGICIGGQDWSTTDSTVLTSGDYTVTKNIIHDVVEERTFSAIGIKLGTTRAGVATNNLVANNFIYNIRADGTSGDQLVGIGYSGGHTDRIVFNSLSLTGDLDPGAASSAATYGNALRVSTVNGTNNVNLTLMDNSIYLDVNSNTATVHFYDITLPSNAYAFGTGGLNYNNYYFNAGNAQLRTGGLGTGTGAATTTEFLTLANWQAALTVPQDANSIQADPLYFSNTSNLHIQTASPNINTGTNIAGITDDIDAQVRPNGATSDIGADEFYTSPGTVQFSSATYNTTESSGTVTITVTRSSGANGAISVDYATVAGGSATGGAACTAGVDYINTSGTLNWADLDIAPKMFSITICPDGVLKGSETVNLALSNPTGGATLGTPNTAVLTIANSTTFGAAVNVGTAEVITSLTNPGGLFEQINNGVLTGNLTVNITSDLTAETGAIALNQFAGGFTITIQPSGGARLISGGSATVLLNFNGADGVTINGLNTGGNSLTIRNTAAGTGTAVQFINDASNNSVLNTTLEGGGTSAVLFINTGTTTGNDNITVTGNTIRDRSDAASIPFNSINLIGTSAAISNSNILINNNQIFNFTQAGIVVGTSDNVTFTGNNIFQTAPRTTALFGVAVNSAAGTNTFSQNQIHDLTTTVATTGMAFNDARATTVSRNRIYNFPSTSGSTGTLAGIQFNGSSGNPAAVTLVNNMVSIIPAFTNAQNIFGIRDFAFGGNTYTAYYNSVLLGGTGSGTSNTWACQRGFAAPTTFTQINNLCFNNRTGGTGNHFAAGDQSQGTGTFVSNFNIFVGTGATAANFFDKATSSTSVPVNFATWQAGPPTRDANSQASNPGGVYTVANVFVSTTDLHLLYTPTNPAIGTGDGASTGVTTDYDNDPRPAANPDIGADEIVQPVAGVLPSGTFYNAAAGGSVLGGNVTITGTMTLTGGTVNANGNTLTFGCGATVTGQSINNFVYNGPVVKQFCAPELFTFPVGTATNNRSTGDDLGFTGAYSPVTANVTAVGVVPSSLTVTVTDSFMTGVDTANSIDRFWTLTETGDITTDLTFQYTDNDVNGNESLYKVLRNSGGMTVSSPSSTVNTGANTASITGVQNFSDWSVGLPLVVAASVDIGGRVTMADGTTGIPKVNVTITGSTLSEPIVLRTNPFGYYNFPELPVGTYIIEVASKQYTFSQPMRVVQAEDNITNADFIANQ